MRDPAVDVSVVVVTHNGRERALSTISSVRAAMGPVTSEWFIVDCGSTDGTPDEIARLCPDVRVLRRANLGFAAGNNVALTLAQGRYVLLLNPDVTIAHGTVATLVDALDERSEVGVAGVAQRSPEGHPLASTGHFPSITRQFSEALRLTRLPYLGGLQEMDHDTDHRGRERSVDWLVGAFLFARRTAVEEVGLLDERFFLYSEEKDWCLRFHGAGWDVRHLPVMEIVHHMGGYERPGLLAQLAYSKLLFARKHFGWPRRSGIRLGLVVRHALGVIAFGLGRGRASGRGRNEREALRVAMGRQGSPFQP